MRRRPFTLIEIVVAMAIMMLIAMILGSAGAAFYNSYNRCSKISDKLDRYMAIDRIWDNCVRNIIPFEWLDSEGTLRFVFLGEEERLLFTSLRRCYEHDPGSLIFIKLEVTDNCLVASTSFYPMLPWEEDIDENNFDDSVQEVTREVLATNVKSVSFKYAEQNTGEDAQSPLEWVEYWDEDEHNAIPLAIQMKVEFLDETSEVWLRRVAGVSHASTFGSRELPDDTGLSTTQGTGGARR